MEYYERKLDPLQQKFYRKIVETLRRRDLFVIANGITEKEKFLSCIEAVLYDYPEFFYVALNKIEYYSYENGWEYRPQYLYDEKQIIEKQKRISSLIRRFENEIKKRNLTSIYQICGFIHAYLVRNCIYDYSAMDESNDSDIAYTIEGPLLEKKGVCQGIALSYHYILRKFDIRSIVVKGVSLRPGNTNYESHAWNIICDGHNATHVDVTWDMCLSSDDWPIQYDYFFQPDIEMMRDHQYVGYPSCRRINNSYYERNKIQFRELNEMDSFIKEKILGMKSNVCYFQFKIINRKETEEEIREKVLKYINKYIKNGYKYSIKMNNVQSVFSYKIQFI